MRNSEIKRTLRIPRSKADVVITIEANGKRFTLNAHRALHRKYRLKVGRSWSRKYPLITLSEIFDKARSWAIHQEQSYWRGHGVDF